MRDIFVRHRVVCRNASTFHKNPQAVAAEIEFLAAATPSLQGFSSRHADPNVAPFEFNGSLAKLGVREKLAAEGVDRSVKLDYGVRPRNRSASRRSLDRQYCNLVEALP